MQISAELSKMDTRIAMITGGGAKNAFLLSRIKHNFQGLILIPDEEIIESKEAIIFAFLGALNLSNVPNCLASVTGAAKDVIGGEIHLP